MTALHEDNLYFDVIYDILTPWIGGECVGLVVGVIDYINSELKTIKTTGNSLKTNFFLEKVN